MAAEDYIFCDMWDDRWEDGGEPPDPLYYHHQIKFTRFLGQTKKAYHLDIVGVGEVWIPISICRELDKAAGSVWVHSRTYKAVTNIASRSDLDF